MPSTVRFHSIGGPKSSASRMWLCPCRRRTKCASRRGRWVLIAVAFIKQGLIAGTLAPKVDAVFELADIADAYRYLESNIQFGKVVVPVPGSDAVS